MYKYAKTVLTFLVHIKHQVVDGIALSIHCGSKGAYSSIHHTLNINQNYFVIAETYQNCK